MLTNSREIIRRLEREGWVLVRVTGSHHVFKNPVSGETLVIPHPRKTWERDWYAPSTKAQAGSPIEVSHGSLRRDC